MSREPPWARLTRRGAQARDNRDREAREVVRLLREPGCAACRAGADARGYWLTAYVNEMHADADVATRVRRALGLCPAHTRMLLVDTSQSWITPQLFLDALEHGLRLLDGAAEPVLTCPCCANVARGEQAVYDRLHRMLRDPRTREPVADAYAETGGLCLPHTVELLARMPYEQAGPVAATARRRLDGPITVALLAGEDADAPARASLNRPALLPAEQAALDRSVETLLRRDLRAGCCPLCRRAVRATHRYLTWLTTETSSRRPSPEDAVLCPRHLHDATRITDPEGGVTLDADHGAEGGADSADGGAAWVLARARAQWVVRVDRFIARLAQVPGGRFRQGGAAYRGLAAWLADMPGCRACTAASGAADRARREIAVALRDDRLAAAYGRAHGVCVHHALTWDGPARVGGVAGARAAAMAVELGEQVRKNSWTTRHEAHGAETTAHRRAPTVLDGRIYAGLSAAEAGLGYGIAAEPPSADRTAAARSGPPRSGVVHARSTQGGEGG